MARILLQWRQRNTSATADSLYQPKRPRQEKALITCWLCQVSQGGVNWSAIAPHPKQHGVFQAFWRSHLPDFTTLHQGRKIKTTTSNRSCVMIVSWYVSCLWKTHVLCWDLPRIPPKKKHCRAEELLRVLGVATSVTTSLKAKGACSTGLFTSAATKYENESNGQNGRKAWWNHIEINRFSSWTQKNDLLKIFCQRVKYHQCLDTPTKTVKLLGWSLYAEIKVALEMTPPPAKSHVQFSWASPRRMLQESPSGEVSYIFSMGTTRSQGNI